MSHKLIPGDPVEFAKLPLGAICEFVNVHYDTLWVKFSARKAMALLSEKMAAKCPEVVLEDIPKWSVVRRYWIIGSEGNE